MIVLYRTPDIPKNGVIAINGEIFHNIENNILEEYEKVTLYTGHHAASCEKFVDGYIRNLVVAKLPDEYPVKSGAAFPDLVSWEKSWKMSVEVKILEESNRQILSTED